VVHAPDQVLSGCGLAGSSREGPPRAWCGRAAEVGACREGRRRRRTANR